MYSFLQYNNKHFRQNQFKISEFFKDNNKLSIFFNYNIYNFIYFHFPIELFVCNSPDGASIIETIISRPSVTGRFII